MNSLRSFNCVAIYCMKAMTMFPLLFKLDNEILDMEK